MAGKGKQIADKTQVSKRKVEGSEKSDGRKRKNPGVLQFFEVDAEVDEDSNEESRDDDDFDLDFMDEDNVGHTDKIGKVPMTLPFVPKEEEMSDGELEKLIEERYKPGSKYVVYADDRNKATGSSENDLLTHSADDPIIWRVKCTVGRERRTVFCLIQKFADLQSLGNGLKIASAFSPDHVKGYIYIEADRESDVLEACKGLGTIYSSRISQVPKNEVAHLFSIRNKSVEVLPGTWVRVKLGKYRGDLAQVVAFDNTRKSVTVKVIPRIDLEALAQKLAGGGTVKEKAIPDARVISSRDLEKFRAHIMVTRDGQTGKKFETLDGLKLKDGYLYKKVSIDSISYVDVVPTADELLKFKPCKKDASDDQEWLSHLYGEQRKKRLFECSGGTTKGLEGTSGTKKGNNFQLHDLVCFGPEDFGVVIGVESDGFQILKYHEVEGAEVLNVELHEIQSGSCDRKFTIMDHEMKATSIKDSVRVLDGPFKGRQGVVKHICKGTIFIFDENQLENGGYFCARSELCENISHSKKAQHESIGDVFGQGDVFGAQGFEDSTSSPKSPQSFKRPWQEKNNCDFGNRRQGDRDGEFSVGQTLRIRVGPLKGHLCRVISIYRSGLTVKVDSQMKVMSVKREHLSEAGVRKRIDGFGTRGEASGAATESNGWNADPLSTGRTSWPDFSSSDFLPDSIVGTDASRKDKGDDPWGSKENVKEPANSWGNAAGFSGDLEKGKEEVENTWGSRAASKNSTDSWGNAVGWGEDTRKDGKEGDDPWGSKPISEDSGKGKEEGDDPWGSKISKKAADSWGNASGSVEDHEKGKEGGVDTWGSESKTSQNDTGSWGKAAGFHEDPARGKSKEEGSGSWGSQETSKQSKDTWGTAVAFVEDLEKGKGEQGDPWGSKSKSSEKATDSWGNAVGLGEDPARGKSIEEGSGSWGSQETSKQSKDAWGDVAAFGEDLEKGKGGRGDPWRSNAKSSEKATDSWGKAVGFGEDSAREKSKEKGSGSWGSKETSIQPKDTWGNALTFSEDHDKGKGGQDDPWGSKVKSSQNATDGWGNAVGVNEDPARGKSKAEGSGSWGSQGTSKQSKDTWGNAVAFGEDHEKGKEGRDNPWGSKTKSSQIATDGWGNAVGFDEDPARGESKEEGDGSWDSRGTSKKSTDSWGNAVGVGENPVKGKERGYDPWGSKTTSKEAPNSWGTGLGIGEDSGKGKEKVAAVNNDNGWGSTTMAENTDKWGSGSNTHLGQEDSWSKGTQSWNGSGKSNSDWTQSKTAEKTSSGWKNGACDTGTNNSSGWGNGSNWNSPNGENKSSDWTSGGNNSSGWGGGNTNTWRGGKSSGGGRGFDNDGEPSNYSTRGRGFGRGGRSGSNRGGFARGHDNDAGESSDFSNRGRGFGRGGYRGGSGNRGRGRRDQSSDWSSGKPHGDGQSFGWGKSLKDDTGDQGGGWGGSSNSSRGGFGNRGRGRRDQSADWRGGKQQGNDQSFGWSNGSGEQGGGWGSRNGGTNTNEGGWGKSTGGNGGTSGRGGGQTEDSWGKATASSWQDGSGEQGGGWGSQNGESKTTNSEGGWGKSTGGSGGTSGRGGGQREDSWGKAAASSWRDGSSEQGGGWGNQNGETNNSEGGWGKSTGGSGGTSGRGGGQTEDSWGKAAASSWRDGSSEQGGGWGNRDGETNNSEGGWGKSTGASGGTSEGGWGKSTGGSGGTSGRGGGQTEDTWGKAATSSWGMEASGSGGKGGW